MVYKGGGSALGGEDIVPMWLREREGCCWKDVCQCSFVRGNGKWPQCWHRPGDIYSDLDMYLAFEDLDEDEDEVAFPEQWKCGYICLEIRWRRPDSREGEPQHMMNERVAIALARVIAGLMEKGFAAPPFPANCYVLPRYNPHENRPPQRGEARHH